MQDNRPRLGTGQTQSYSVPEFEYPIECFQPSGEGTAVRWTTGMILNLIEGVGAGALTYFCIKVLDKIAIDRAANAVEERLLQPALDYVKTAEFWDSLDMLVAGHAGRNVTFAAKALLFDFGKAEGVDMALDYVNEHFSDIKHDAKQNLNLTNYIFTED